MFYKTRNQSDLPENQLSWSGYVFFFFYRCDTSGADPMAFIGGPLNAFCSWSHGICLYFETFLGEKIASE